MKYERNPKTGRFWYDLTGDRYGRWLVLGCSGRSGELTGKMHGQTLWRCQCDCGRVKEHVGFGALRSGTSSSCGCFRGEELGRKAKKHGGVGTKAYVAWQQAKDRCFNEGRRAWKRYGGRGITVCEGFRDNFGAWRDALGPEPSRFHTVDRRDNEGHYSCGLCNQCVQNRWKFNIHWATRMTQGGNTSRVRRFLWLGRLRSLTEIARLEKVAYCSFRNIVTMTGRVGAAVEYCRAKGLTYKERAKSVLKANGMAPHRPNRTYRKKCGAARELTNSVPVTNVPL